MINGCGKRLRVHAAAVFASSDTNTQSGKRSALKCRYIRVRLIYALRRARPDTNTLIGPCEYWAQQIVRKPSLWAASNLYAQVNTLSRVQGVWNVRAVFAF